MKHTLLITTALVFSGPFALACPELPSNDLITIHDALRKAPGATVWMGTTRYVLVNERFEDCTTHRMARKEGRYIKRIEPAQEGWSVTVLTPSGALLLDATSLDPMGNVLHGECRYYDANRTLRAQGRYDHGLKTGNWVRFDANGRELPAKVYYGEEWDVMQVRVGVATMSRTQEPETIAEF